MKCYLCGKEMKKEEITGDHIIPDCFYSEKDKKLDNLPTAKAHMSCNQNFQAIEDYAKDCYLFSHNPRDYPEQNKKLRNKYKKFPGYRQYLINSSPKLNCYKEDGEFVGQQNLHLTLVEVHEQLIRKIVRGFIFLHKLKDEKKQMIPHSVPLTIMLIPYDDSFSIYSRYTNVKRFNSFDNVWKYWAWIEPNLGNKWNGAMDVVLFNNTRFFVFIGDEHSRYNRVSHTSDRTGSSLIIRLQFIGEFLINGKVEKVYTETPSDIDLFTYEPVVESLKKIRTDIFKD